MAEIHGLQLQSAGLLDISIQEGLYQSMCVLRDDICGYGDHSKSAQRKQRKHLIIISGIDIDAAVCQCSQVCDLRDISGCFLDGNDVVHFLSQLHCGCRKDVAACTAGYVVHDDRNGYCIRDLGIMTDQTVLCCFIIIRSYDKQSVYAALLSFLGKLHSGIGCVGTGSCDHRDTSVYLLCNNCDTLRMLFLCQCGCFTCSSAYDDGICAMLHVPVGDLSQLLVINLKILLERCNKCNS